MLRKSQAKKSDAWYVTIDIYPRTSRTSKFWQTYLNTYGDFMIIIKVKIIIVKVYQIGTPEYQEVVLRAPVSRFLCLVKLPLWKHGHSTFKHSSWSYSKISLVA